MKRSLLFLGVLFLVAATGSRSVQAERPLIGITSVYKPGKKDVSSETAVSFAYVLAVAENGGVPLVLPTIADEQIVQRYVEVLDGLVLVGGDDIPPSAYGETPHKKVKPLPSQRYEFERKLIARWLESGKPVLGACLGMQFANVVSGGSLIQDIPSQVGKTVGHRGYHSVRIEPGSVLAGLLGSQEASVFSSHHQAVSQMGRGLRVAAHSADGVIEALERTDGRFGLFVQWHPEEMKDIAHRNAIYGALIRACAKAEERSESAAKGR